MSNLVVVEWGPSEAGQLQQALRLTNEAFAERLGSATRTIAKWHANADMRLTLEMQQALDTMLARATEDEQSRFEQLRASAREPARRHTDWGRRLDAGTHLASALDWLDGIRQVGDGTTAGEVEELLAGAGERELRAAGRARARVDRRQVAQVVRDYYRAAAGYGHVTLAHEGGQAATTILSSESWNRASLDLRTGTDAFALEHPAEIPLEPDADLVPAAVHRLAEILVGRTRFIDAPVYRLLTTHPAGRGVGATFGLDSFARYALSWDLLEAEAIDVVRGVGTELRLRDRLLPDVGSVLDPASRICVGGAQALCAFARPASGSGPGDYLLLVQSRSPLVVNAAGRLAAIPKCFHQPINDAAGEVSIGASLLRELEEELFGRAEVDLGAGGPPLADPMHPSRLTEPMRWLLDSHDWDLQETGFGFNLISGNYEFCALLAVRDEQFWSRYGGTIEGNWEASGLRRYSSMDAEGLAVLLTDPTWSDEGLVTFARGLTRLAELDPGRVALPPLEIGVTA